MDARLGGEGQRGDRALAGQRLVALDAAGVGGEDVVEERGRFGEALEVDRVLLVPEGGRDAALAAAVEQRPQRRQADQVLARVLGDPVLPLAAVAVPDRLDQEQVGTALVELLRPSPPG